MKYTLTLLGQDIVVNYSYKITQKRITPTRDDPGCAMEYEITDVDLFTEDGTHLPTPKWLQNMVTLYLEESDAVYEDIENE